MGARNIEPVRGRLDADLEATPSKSVTHRALVAAALARGESVLANPLDAEDTRATRNGLEQLGVPIRDDRGCWVVTGSEGRLAGGGCIALGDSGTSLRLLAAVATLGRRSSRLEGSPRLTERPLAALSRALRELGAEIHCDPEGEGLPLDAGGGAPPLGGAVRIPADQSSQFASALLMIGPMLERGLELTLAPPAVSLPYVELTAAVLEEFGGDLHRRSELEWQVGSGGLRGRSFTIEGDHSSAAFFLTAAAVVGGRVRVAGLRRDSLQADARLTELLARLNCKVRQADDRLEVEGTGRIPAFEVDLSQSPDLAPAVAILALFAEGPSVIRGVAHLRHKESDRLELLARNLRALGRDALALDERLVVGAAPPCLGGAEIETGSDHRMAMAFAVAGLKLEGVRIDDSECVAKSNRDFWDQLAELTG